MKFLIATKLVSAAAGLLGAVAAGQGTEDPHPQPQIKGKLSAPLLTPPLASADTDKEQNIWHGPERSNRRKNRRTTRRSLYDSGEHYTAGADVILPFPDDKSHHGSEQIFKKEGFTFSFGQLTYITGDVIGPYSDRHVLCSATSYKEQVDAAKYLKSLYDEGDGLASPDRIGRAQKGMQLEIDAASSTTKTFQKHVKVHSTSYAEMEKIDDVNMASYAFCGGAEVGDHPNTACMLAINHDHFTDCAMRTYQTFHDLALEEAAKNQDLTAAYFYEGLGSHALTDLFSSGHVRAPGKRLRMDHCGALRGGFATNQMHDEDSYNGLYMTNRIKSKEWWVYGDSFYFEDFAQENKNMMHQALQESINQVFEAYNKKENGPGHSGKKMYDIAEDLPGRGLDYVPSVKASEAMPDYWHKNTCPLIVDDGEMMYERYPLYRLRSRKGRSSSFNQPSSTKFGLYNNTFPVKEDVNQFQLFKIPPGTPHLIKGEYTDSDGVSDGCFYKRMDSCRSFGYWDANSMFYSPEAGGFLNPTLATCQAYSKKAAFDNDCYDVLEYAAEGQACDDVKEESVCKMLSPRCSWSSGTLYSGTCSQGNCVAFSNQEGDIVSGDPTPPAPLAPDGFYMSFQGACAFHNLPSNNADFEELAGDINIETCGDHCRQRGDCTGIAVGKKDGSSTFNHCVLYLNNACDRADGVGFDRCATNNLQAFHRDDKGEITQESIMDKCACANDWYYKDITKRYSGCTAVEAKSWGNWCYLENPDECELGMYSSTQPENKWRHCGESTCENFSCPDYYTKRDTVTCYDDKCSVEDCCESCERMKSKEDCDKFTLVEGSCTWWEDKLCIFAGSTHTGCDHYSDQKSCEGNTLCYWYDAWWPKEDYCTEVDGGSRLLQDKAGEQQNEEQSGGNNTSFESFVDALADDMDFINILGTPLSSNASLWFGEMQLKVKTLINAAETLEERSPLFFALSDGRYFGIKSCDHGPSCWSKYNDPDWIFAIAYPSYSEFIYLLQVVSGNITLHENRISEFGVPDMALDEFHVNQQTWHGVSGWSSPYTCTVLHPDQAEICRSYTKTGTNYTFGVETIYSMSKKRPVTSTPKASKAPKAPKSPKMPKTDTTKMPNSSPKTSKAPKDPGVPEAGPTKSTKATKQPGV